MKWYACLRCRFPVQGGPRLLCAFCCGSDKLEAWRRARLPLLAHAAERQELLRQLLGVAEVEVEGELSPRDRDAR